MQVKVPWGRQVLSLDVRPEQILSGSGGATAPPLADVGAATRAALDQPFDFPPLYRALTPDDHVAIAIDESIPNLTKILVPLLEHLSHAHVAPEAITLICFPPTSGQPWLDDLPDDYQEVHVEVHQPGDRRKLAYLATTKQGRRIYLNRSAVDADQLVLLSRRAYDTRLGVRGAEGDLYPALSDAETLEEIHAQLSLAPPDTQPSRLRREAAEVAWLLGAPFLLQVIEGAGTDIVHIVGGTLESSAEGQRRLDAQWRVAFDHPADVVIASIIGDPGRQSMHVLAQAFQSAARIVKAGGKIALLTDALPEMGTSMQMIRDAVDPAQALSRLMDEKPPDLETGFLWASAAEHANLYLLSQLPSSIVEELFATPLDNPAQVQKLMGPGLKCIVLPDAHKTLAVIQSELARSSVAPANLEEPSESFDEQVDDY